jgi:hypothetical protein
MQTLTVMPVLFAAAQYSLAYMLLGGGVLGAVVIYIVAKSLGKQFRRHSFSTIP